MKRTEKIAILMFATFMLETFGVKAPLPFSYEWFWITTGVVLYIL